MPESMADRYNTSLPPYEEVQFHAWAFANRKLEDLRDYDLRGLWKASGGNMPTGDQHGPDTYKKPNHPTFSDESIYHGVDGHLGGRWTRLGQDRWRFWAGPANLTHHGATGLTEYFQTYEPGQELVVPTLKGAR